MPTIALAGATTGFGLTVLNTFLRLNRGGKGHHDLVLLSRFPRPEFTAQGVDVRPVDYTNHAELVSALKGVHTLLSLVGGSQQGLLGAQLAMIEAAKEAGVKRFAPSEYAGNGYEGVDLYAPKAVVWEATQKSGLEYSRISCGMFMSVLATGTPKPLTEVGIREGKKTGEEEALAGLRPWNFIINIRAGTADLATDGTTPMVLTEMRDIAQFVWLTLDLKTWPPELGMRGDVKTSCEIISMFEKIQGRKFLIKENSIEDLEEGAKDPAKRFYNQARIQLAKGWAMVGDDLNREFPDFKPTTAEEFIEKWWSGVTFEEEPAWEKAKIFGVHDF